VRALSAAAERISELEARLVETRAERDAARDRSNQLAGQVGDLAAALAALSAARPSVDPRHQRADVLGEHERSQAEGNGREAERQEVGR
jgi:hypothetical protein